MPITSGSRIAATSASTSLACSGVPCISMWSAMVTPAAGRSPSNGWTPPGNGCQTQPFALRAVAISIAKSQDSASCENIIRNGRRYGAIAAAMRDFWAAESLRGLKSCSIVRCCVDIVRSCAPLIRSSNTNRKTVHNDSMAMPPSTNHVATLCTASEYLGDSSNIPAPTVNAANMLTDKRKTWGQSGSASPAQTALKYVSVGAIISWLIVSLLAPLVSLIRSVVALWQKHHASGNG